MTVVTAHRGASAAHPPGNTLAAFRGARAQGADWVELDVRRTADGVVVVHHDEHLPDGRALAATVADRLPDWVPTLRASLEACAGMGVNVEIKADDPAPTTAAGASLVADTIAVLHDPGPVTGLVVSCFDWSVVDRVRAEAPGLATALLAFDLDREPDPIAAAVARGHRGVNPWDPFVTPDLVVRAHAAGIEVHAWTVDDPLRMADLVTMGVDGIITNVPDVARAVVDGFR
ncbi:MAG: glycerophosphodiester phosphodiesterase [Acidimicrobiales bacterium]|jgi:glycerophosphoryl diester phosphodiesterase|nr:glycerophosphodiester phosphodiesterase [Acidimicrobiales bacterium]